MKMNSAYAAAFAAALLTTGCLTAASSVNPEKVAQAVTVNDDEFRSSITFAGPSLWNWSPPAPYEAMLAAFLDKDTGKIRHRLSVRWKYTKRHWLHLDNPTIAGGTQLPTEKLHDTNSCTRYGCERVEVLVSELPKGYLEDARDGIRIRYNSEAGYIVVEFPQPYVTGFLAGVTEKMGYFTKEAPQHKNTAQRNKRR